MIENRVGELLLSKGLMMGTAESCTGGYIASLITSVPGSSSYFSGGIISYNNEVKHRILGVSSESLLQFGAVSQAVVQEMVTGVIRVLGCDCAVATSGIAGPSGGSPEKPVGTVWIAAACREQITTNLFHFSGTRQDIIEQASSQALTMLCSLLEIKD